MARAKRHRLPGRVREAPAAEYPDSTVVRSLTGVLLDSDVIIDVLRGRKRTVDALAQLEGSGTATYSTAISRAEIQAGLRPGEEVHTDAFFAARGEVVLDGRIGRQAGSYLARYGRAHGVELADALIAAAASVTGLSLWTLNRRHYPMPDVTHFEPG